MEVAQEEPAAPEEPIALAMLRAQFGDALLDHVFFRDEVTVRVKAERIVEVCRFLRDAPDLRFNLMADLTAIDWLPTDREPRFQVVYHLYSIPYSRRLRLKIDVDEENPVANSIVDVWPTANWFEREVYDMYGIRFAGHPDLRRILMPDDWPTHPLRKDVPLGEEAVEFSHNQRPNEPQ